MASINTQELTTLNNLLHQLAPGFLPYEIFVEIARLAALSIIEFVPLRLTNSDTVEVLLLVRDEADPIWPGELHTPGTVIRPTDTEGNIYLAFERILSDELKNTAVSPPCFVGSILHKSKRGTEHAQIYWVEVMGQPKVGCFYPVDALPENLMKSQTKFIRQAVKNYRQSREI